MDYLVTTIYLLRPCDGLISFHYLSIETVRWKDQHWQYQFPGVIINRAVPRDMKICLSQINYNLFMAKKVLERPPPGLQDLIFAINNS